MEMIEKKNFAIKLSERTENIVKSEYVKSQENAGLAWDREEKAETPEDLFYLKSVWKRKDNKNVRKCAEIMEVQFFEKF